MAIRYRSKTRICSDFKIIFSLIFGFCWSITGCTANVEYNWHQEDSYAWAELYTDNWENTGFEKLDLSSSGIQFTNTVRETSILENRNFLNGSGIATGDVDGDGLVDIYFAQLDGPNKLYKNLGSWRFQDITHEAGVAHEGYNSSGVVFADVDGDGDLDLLITSLTENNELYINDGEGRFTLKGNSGLGPSKGSNTMTLADIDSDGDLDLYISNYKLKTVRDIYTAEELSTKNTLRRQGDSLVVVAPYDQYYGIIQTANGPHRLEYGEEDEIYLNNGKGFFEKVENTEKMFLDMDGSGKGIYPDWGLTAKFHDINGDMHPDLFVANDFWTPDRIWINKGDGTFQSMDSIAVRNLSYSSMGIDFSDINRDGYIDFFVTEMLSAKHQRRMRQYSEHLGALDGRPQYNRNSMYLNRGDNTFAEIAYYSNLEASEWSWATNFLDVDFDGYEDLIITTGHSYDYQDMDTQLQMGRKSNPNLKNTGSLLQYPTLELNNKIFKNNGDLTFVDKSHEWGFTEKDVSLGLSIADLDNDGDPDLVVNRLNQEAAIYKNKTASPRIAVRLNGKSPNTKGIGAKIKLEGAGVTQTKEMAAGGSYVSGSVAEVYFAADETNDDHTLTITWPQNQGKKVTTIDSVKANRIYLIDEPEVSEVADIQHENETVENQLFIDITNRLDHFHHEDPYNDFNVQPLLPLKLSRQGPGISWIDYDRDEDDDLFIGSGKGGQLAVFENTGEGQFRSVNIDRLTQKAAGDHTSILGWSVENKQNFVVGSANFEQGDAAVPSAFYYTFENDMITNKIEIPGILSTTGPLAAADYDDNNTIDLFIGGRFNPGKYPENSTSRLFKYENEGFQLDRMNAKILQGIGLVTGAVFTDYDLDGDVDLLLSREWDSLVLLENNDGIFRDVSSDVGLDSFKGWWNSVATGDFNNDGRPDIIATNIGENSPYQVNSDSALKMYYDDFNRDGQLDIVDAYYEPGMDAYAPRRKLYEFNSVPTILRFVNSHEEFANSTVDEIFGYNFDTVPSKEINTVEHTLFINTGDGFVSKPLPTKAQFSAAFHAGVADFDNDGNEDLFLSQNVHSFPPGIPRIDAGRGLILKGNGKGDFKTIPGHKSGIKIYGEQRGAGLADFNRDGRIDVAVSQNKSTTKLYMNDTPKKGIRIRMVGPENNEDAIGTSIRLVYADGNRGPLKELQAGTGYWSQNSMVPVLGYSKEPVAIQINWFDGSKDSLEITSDIEEKIIEY